MVSLHTAFEAIAFAEPQRLHGYLRAGLPVNSQSYSGYTLLLRAAMSGQNEMVKLLLDNGADIELANLFGETPLMLACRKGHATTVRLLLDRRANPNTRDIDDRSPLLHALAAESEDSVRLLVTAGAKVDAQDGDHAVMWATLHQRPELIEFLIQYGANPGASIKGHTVLAIAISPAGLHTATALKLVQLGAPISEEVNDRALTLAVEADSAELIQALHQRGMPLDRASYDRNRTALRETIYREKEKAFFALLQAGVNPNIHGDTDLSALAFAVMKRRPVTWLDALVQAGASLENLDRSPRGALFEACVMKQWDSAQFLLDHLDVIHDGDTAACLLTSPDPRIANARQLHTRRLPALRLPAHSAE